MTRTRQETTTVRISSELARTLKHQADMAGRSLSKHVEILLRSASSFQGIGPPDMATILTYYIKRCGDDLSAAEQMITAIEDHQAELVLLRRQAEGAEPIH